MFFKETKNSKSRQKRNETHLRFAKPGGTRKKRVSKAKENAAAQKRKAVDCLIFVKAATKVMAKLLSKTMRMVLVVTATVIALIIVSAVLISGYLYISKSDYFAVRKVTISGIERIQHDEVLEITGLNNPVNILTFDVEAAEDNLKMLQWLDGVNISRSMPDTINIEVLEHKPKLIVSLGRLYYMNEHGVPFKALESGEKPEMPIVSGFSQDELLNPGPVTKQGIEEVFWLVKTLSARNDEFRLDNISEINYDSVRGLTLFGRTSGLEVKIGFGAYEEKFRRLGRVLAYLKVNGKYEGLNYLNLEASPRVIVRYKSGSVFSRQDV